MLHIEERGKKFIWKDRYLLRAQQVPLINYSQLMSMASQHLETSNDAAEIWSERKRAMEFSSTELALKASPHQDCSSFFGEMI